jgi:dolichol-phosphate mannosyltransferase
MAHFSNFPVHLMSTVTSRFSFDSGISTQAFRIIACLTLIRLVYIAFAPVTGQEVYYWLYAKNPALAYVDHPPMIAYSIYLGTLIFGDNGFGIKFMGVVASSLTNLFIYWTVVRAGADSPSDSAEKSGVLAVVIYNLTLFAHAFAIIQQPDNPLLLFWILVLFFIQEFQLTGKARNLIYAGISLGLAMLCKYTAVALLPGIVVALLLTPDGRRCLLTPYPWLAVLAACLVFSPVVYWNWTHDWASFQMQFNSRGQEITSQRSIQFKYFFQLLGTQLAMLMPLGFVLLARFYFRMATKWRESAKAHFYFLSGIFLIVGFLLISFTSKVKVHWLLPGYLGVILGIVVVFGPSIVSGSPWFKRGAWFSAALIGLCHLLFLIPGFQIFQVNSWSGWDKLTDQVVHLQKQYGGQEKVFIFAESHKTAAYLTFYSEDHQRTYAKNIVGEFAKQYTAWGIPENLHGKHGLFVSRRAELPESETSRIGRYFDNVSRVGVFSYPLISVGNKPSRDLYVYLATNYQPKGR